MKAIKVRLFIFFSIVLLIPFSKARADMAPPMNPPGGNISPEGGTEVQMVAEKVVIDFSQSLDETAQVSAWFRFHNTSDMDEHLKVRFPLNGEGEDGYKWTIGEPPPMPLIKDFTVLNEGRELPIEIVRDPDPNAVDFFMRGVTVIYWAVFEVDFPAGKDVELNAHYTYIPTRGLHSGINYILATGAGWKGPIGKADVIVRFPYSPNELNTLNFDNLATLDNHGNQTMIVQNEIRIHWDNLEPTREDNVSIGVIPTNLWREVLRWQIQVNKTPQDAHAWTALAGAYAAAGAGHNISFFNARWAGLYIFACENALALEPQNAALHSEFARTIYYAHWRGSDPYYNAIVLREIAATLKLDPKNETALQLLTYVQAEGVYTGDKPPTPGAPYPTPGQPTYTAAWDNEPTYTPNEAGSSTVTPTIKLVSTRTASLTKTPLRRATIPMQPEFSPTQSHLPAEAMGKDWTWLLVFAGFMFVAVVFLTWRPGGLKK